MYRIEGRDIVISGFEQGIADSPYQGIADMRNIEIISVPMEGMVGFKEIAASVPPVLNGVAFTAADATNRLTIPSVTGLYAGCAIVLNTNSAGGITTGAVYYIDNINTSNNSFQVFIDPQMSSAINISSDGSGTLTTYQYGNQRGISDTIPCPQSYAMYNESNGGVADVVNSIFLVDQSNYLWLINLETNGDMGANQLIFMGNIGGLGAGSDRVAVAVWKDYVLLIGDGNANIDIAQIQDLIQDGPLAEWDYAWETGIDTQTNQITKFLVSQNDGNLYFTSETGLGSLLEVDGETFNPTNTATYSITSDALSLPTNDRSTCIAELGDNLYVGGVLNYVYPWNRQNLGFNPPLFIPENYVSFLVGTDQNVFIFSGNRGRIYITNGASVDLFKKIPDYITGSIAPKIKWGAVGYGKNQLYCAFDAWSNSGTLLTTVGGTWAIDIDTKALRMVNKLTNSGYAGHVSMIVDPLPVFAAAVELDEYNESVGTGLYVGWSIIDSATVGVDIPDDEPYQALESYIDTDIIPVGTYLNPLSPSQIEWKTSVPLGANGTAETITVYYRTNLYDSFTQLGTTTATGTSVVGSTTGTTVTSAVSDYYQANFQKAQWVQFRVAMSSNATTPTYNRLTELRVRDFTAS